RLKRITFLTFSVKSIRCIASTPYSKIAPLFYNSRQIFSTLRVNEKFFQRVLIIIFTRDKLRTS
ncbi:MAG: hypothetical protein IJG33_13555, partial [Selenomonadaceae bacterium]|nr:hypothetical protein [Selenomonadaceae bacterium]